MTYDGPDMHHRRSIRLPGYDYAQPGAYFVTICTHGRECVLGEVMDGRVNLSPFGEVVHEEWERSAVIRPELELDAFVIMPSHLHGIVVITGDVSVGLHSVGAHGRAPLHRAPRSLGSFIAGFKSTTTRRVNLARGTPGASFWQRGYYEHVIRDAGDLEKIGTYIAENPLSWGLDENFPDPRPDG